MQNCLTLCYAKSLSIVARTVGVRVDWSSKSMSIRVTGISVSVPVGFLTLGLVVVSPVSTVSVAVSPRSMAVVTMTISVVVVLSTGLVVEVSSVVRVSIAPWV